MARAWSSFSARWSATPEVRVCTRAPQVLGADFLPGRARTRGPGEEDGARARTITVSSLMAGT